MKNVPDILSIEKELDFHSLKEVREIMARNRLYGIGEPVWVREVEDGIPAETTMEIINAIGFGSWREWMHITSVLENPTTPKKDVVERMTQILNKAAELDIEVTGMSHSWFLPEGCVEKSGCFMPKRDLTPGKPVHADVGNAGAELVYIGILFSTDSHVGGRK